VLRRRRFEPGALSYLEWEARMVLFYAVWRSQRRFWTSNPGFRILCEPLISARCLCIMSRIAIFLVASFATCARLAIADTNYSRTVELPPLRVSFEDLQAILDKVSSLVIVANKGSSNWEEELQLRKGEQRIKMSGHRLEPEGAKVPRSIDSFEYTGRVSYTGRDSDEAPITHVAISFYDYKRSVSVEGRSPEQVDAMISALRDDLSKLSIPFGNFGKTFLTWPGLLFGGPIWLLGLALFVIWRNWVQTRRRILVVPAMIFVLLLIALLVLPLDEIFAGFSAVHGEAYLLIRYGPEITFLGLVFTFLGLVGTVISLFPGPRVSK
jgi:hypothetical protein